CSIACATSLIDRLLWYLLLVFFFNDPPPTEIYPLSHTTLFRSDVDGAAEVARDHADRGAEHEAEPGGRDADQQRDAGAVDGPAQHVAAQVVGAERVLRRRLGEDVAAELLERGVRRDPRREDRGEHEHGDQ